MTRQMSNDDKVLTQAYIKRCRMARKEGITRTTRLHNYQCEVLIVCAWRYVMSHPQNAELVDVVRALYDTYKKGYFSNDT